jgi:signal transduction histidine kinase
VFVSHELRNPLTSIKGCISTVENVKDLSDDERSELHEIVLGETDRLLRMINELLDLSRVQAGKPLTLNREWFDINRSLKKLVNMTALDKKTHTFVYHGAADPVMVNADSDKIQQIVVNLLSNAVKYSPEGSEVELILGLDQSQVEISVKDHGVGMTEDQARRAFDKFYRVSEHESTDASIHLRRVEGTGVGLYLTRALVEAHGGGINVTSEPGVGSTFTVHLPRQVPTPALVDEPASSKEISEITLTLLGNEFSPDSDQTAESSSDKENQDLEVVER